MKEKTMTFTKLAFAAALGTAALCAPAFAQQDQGGTATQQGAAASSPDASAQSSTQTMAQNSTAKHTKKHQKSSDAQGGAMSPAGQSAGGAATDSQSSPSAGQTQTPSPQ
jgi:hypothetical protein